MFFFTFWTLSVYYIVSIFYYKLVNILLFVANDTCSINCIVENMSKSSQYKNECQRDEREICQKQNNFEAERTFDLKCWTAFCHLHQSVSSFHHGVFLHCKRGSCKFFSVAMFCLGKEKLTKVHQKSAKVHARIDANWSLAIY